MEQHGSQGFSKTKYVLYFLQSRLKSIATFQFVHGWVFIPRSGSPATLAVLNALCHHHEAVQESASGGAPTPQPLADIEELEPVIAASLADLLHRHEQKWKRHVRDDDAIAIVSAQKCIDEIDNRIWS